MKRTNEYNENNEDSSRETLDPWVAVAGRFTKTRSSTEQSDIIYLYVVPDEPKVAITQSITQNLNTQSPG